MTPVQCAECNEEPVAYKLKSKKWAFVACSKCLKAVYNQDLGQAIDTWNEMQKTNSPAANTIRYNIREH